MIMRGRSLWIEMVKSVSPTQRWIVTSTQLALVVRRLR